MSVERLILLKDDLKVLDSDIDMLCNQRAAVRHEIAELNCPFKVGDVIANHHKKPASYKISRIEWYVSDSSFIMYGHKIKKDGGLGIVENHLYDWHDDFTLVE